MSLDRGASRQGSDTALAESLDHYGYEPRCEDGGVRLGICPFRALAQDHPDLVCGMNLGLMEGVMEGMGAVDLQASLEFRPGERCVTVNPRTQDRPA